MDGTKILACIVNGAVEEVKVGQTVIIQMNEIPTSGYRWTLQVSNAAAVAVTDKGWHQTADAQAGPGGHHEFSLFVREKGVTQVTLKHWREWKVKMLH
jgi:inhibitor of cysteine peptidase